MGEPDLLEHNYTIDTPESVSFGYPVADIGSRFIGALIDSTLLILALLALNIALIVGLSALGAREPAADAPVTSEDPGWLVGLAIAVYALFNFAIIFGYYVAFELRWNGQTPGKRLAGTRVVTTDGLPAGFLAVVIRNLVRLIDFMPFAYAVGLVAMFCNRQARRLGDFAGSTLVVKHNAGITLDDLSTRSQPPALAGSAARPAPVSLRQLSPADYQLIVTALARYDQGAASSVLLQRLALAFAAKLGMPAPAGGSDARYFLESVADGYRRSGVG